MAAPPVLVGATNASETWPLPAVATSEVGAPGTVIAVDDMGITLTLVDAVPAPAALIALRRILYDVLLVRLDITIGEVVATGERTVYVVPPSVLYE
jgi:hypothetical protein